MTLKEITEKFKNAKINVSTNTVSIGQLVIPIEQLKEEEND